MQDPEVKEEKSILRRREPYNFMLGLGIFGMSLMFFILTMLYLQRQARPDWVHFEMPSAFWVSTALILASSFTLHAANLSLRQEAFAFYRLWISLTLGLGLAFIGMQLWGWALLQAQGITLQKSISGAFLFVISGLHIAHLLGGIWFLAVAWVEAFRYRKYVDSFIYSVNPPNQLRIRLITKYWHFVDALWLYLFCFFTYFTAG